MNRLKVDLLDILIGVISVSVIGLKNFRRQLPRGFAQVPTLNSGGRGVHCGKTWLFSLSHCKTSERDMSEVILWKIFGTSSRFNYFVTTLIFTKKNGQN